MRRKSSNFVEVKFFKLDYEKVLEELRKYSQKVLDKGARVVILIGSLAKGDYTAFSDADIVIISDKVPERPMDRIKDFIDQTLSIDVEPRVYTTDEFLKMARDRRRIVKEVLKYGKILAGDETFLEKIRKIYENK
ncbi:MAG: nucleotidyltransferase domain-containing protein [Thermoprotei archaeon]|nr:MAG: nucleotidyltransferase domain-containing protein [Thermoprotei archaeon]